MMNPAIPLPERIRPRQLSEVIGQQHLLSEQAPLRKMIDQGNLPSMIFWGPPGVGKTTLALLLAEAVDRPFISLSAISTGVKELRELIGQGGELSTPVVFIDEIHRFNKSQQDALLAAVEKGKITLIGATTENPSFEVNSALLSRCQVYVLKSLTVEEQLQVIQRALTQDVFLKEKIIELKQTDALLQLAAGDARKLLNLLELVISTQAVEPIIIDNDLVINSAQQNIARYDKSGEQHYDIVSAFIKSMRGSDPDAALYWMARMIKGGEDPVFIARRMLILASEDIGNANPNALLLAGECFGAVQAIGYPECRIILGQTAVYLATSAKSNSTYLAIDAALAAAEKTAHLPVPLHLRNAPTKMMKQQGYGAGYKYAHDFPNHFVPQTYLPPELQGKRFYSPAQNAREQETARLQDSRWQGGTGLKK
ncbi:AAA family ATPase [Alkanindiges hydrocarboniclasticus]|uniref:Replication-associated recombination protein A n=1 Tax=Alkanindiges hydrocarboniclasticus TaxID=1907941 RepID=A0A1S8CWU2_9GAMM|nr:replication-associated recombination protein A [Alkanindiges hydrocarboniclasticus]ONG41289.1 AAA family ATPase [Alkanindiges hydrocarboniclasticus]